MNVCIITSMINFPDKPLSYSKVRSVFTPQERLRQTQHTIASVRRWIPNCKTVLLEAGPITPLVNKLREFVDWTIHVDERLFTHSRHKGLGEAVSLLAAAGQLEDAGDYYFKLSGRYCLTDNFQMENWSRDAFTVRVYGQEYPSMSTRLYGFPSTLFTKWRNALWWSLPWLAFGHGIEYEMYRHLRRSMNELPVLGVSGQIATDGTVLSE